MNEWTDWHGQAESRTRRSAGSTSKKKKSCGGDGWVREYIYKSFRVAVLFILPSDNILYTRYDLVRHKLDIFCVEVWLSLRPGTSRGTATCLPVLQTTIVYLIRYIFSFSCSYTIHDITGSQYQEFVDPGNVLLVLYPFVFMGFCVITRPPKNLNMGLFASFSPPLSLSLSTFWVFRFGNDNCGYRYRYRSYFGLIVAKRFWFRYPTLLSTTISFHFRTDRLVLL